MLATCSFVYFQWTPEELSMFKTLQTCMHVLQRNVYLERFTTKLRWLTSRSVFSRYFFQKGLIFRCPPMSQTFSFMPWEATLFMLKPWGGPQRPEVTTIYISAKKTKEPPCICLWKALKGTDWATFYSSAVGCAKWITARLLYTVTLLCFSRNARCLDGNALCVNPQSFFIRQRLSASVAPVV